MNDINKKKKIILTILIISISLILVVALTLLFLKNITDKKKATMQNELYEKAISFCEPMFINKIIKDNIQTEDITKQQIDD